MRQKRKLAAVIKGLATGVITGVAIYAVWQIAQVRGTAAPSPTARASENAAIPAGDTAGDKLSNWLAAHPSQSIPEIALVDTSSWNSVTTRIRFDSGTSVCEAVRVLRNQGRQAFGMRIASALSAYAAAHDDALPAETSELRPYLDSDVSDAMLNRYAILSSGSYSQLDNETPILGETAAVDDDLDSVLSVSKGILSKISTDRIGAEVQRAIHRYLQSHAGEPPTAATALKPYLQISLVDSDILKYFNKGGLEIVQKR